MSFLVAYEYGKQVPKQMRSALNPIFKQAPRRAKCPTITFPLKPVQRY